MKSYSSLNPRMTLFSAFALSIMLASPALAGTITKLNLSDFTNPQVLDFNSAPVGPISGTDALFTNFGISQVTTIASDFSDNFNVRTNSSRALWHNSDGLSIVDPGAPDNANEISYTLDFSSLHTKFGVGILDQREPFVYTFFNNAANVGSITIDTNDMFQVYLENDMTFNRVTIIPEDGDSGFAIDNITLEGSSSAPVPEPSTMILLGTGLAGILAWRRKK